MGYSDPAKQREYVRQWTARRRAQYLDGRSCVKCGSTDRLEVDHIDRTQKVDHKLWSWSQVRRDAELAKCQVLCHDCHLEKTRADRWPGHGRSLYRRGCRCDICREGQMEYQRVYRARRPGLEPGTAGFGDQHSAD